MKTPRFMRWGTATLAGAVALLLSACAERAPQDFLEPEGQFARTADRLWDLTFGIAVIIFFIVEGVLVYALIRFRHRPDRPAATFHGNTKLEVVLTIIPSLILAGIAVPTVKTIFDLSKRPVDGALEVTVTARQFWWEYEYAGLDVITANELHIPTGQRVHLTLEGADVIHSFWIPKLAGKQDVVPGRVNAMTIRATKPGVYLGQCTEFCGLSHANMRLRVIAQSPDDFDAWVADQQEPAVSPSDSLAAEGEKLFLEGECVNCHAIAGTDAAARTAPDLTHYGSRATFGGAMFRNNAENLAQWLRDPPAVKPGALMPNYGLSEDEIEALVAYLLSLR